MKKIIDILKSKDITIGTHILRCGNVYDKQFNNQNY